MINKINKINKINIIIVILLVIVLGLILYIKKLNKHIDQFVDKKFKSENVKKHLTFHICRTPKLKTNSSLTED